MRVLITGGNGFLGSNLIEHFLSLQYELLIISRNSNNIEEYLSYIKFEKHDSKNYLKHEKAILDFNPQVVIHLAWEGGNNYNNINDLDQVYKNIPAGLSLLEIISKQVHKPKFIGCGSFLEYGTITTRANEDMVENPNSFYGLSKLTFKKTSQMYCDQNDINWSWIRPCYIYGRRDVRTRLIPTVINKLLADQELILDDCSTTIDYLYADDFCSALIKIIETDSSGIFNVCSGEEFNLRDIVNLIKQNIDTSKEVFFDHKLNRSMKPKYVCGSNERLKSITGWYPKTSLESGIIKTIDFYTHNI